MKHLFLLLFATFCAGANAQDNAPDKITADLKYFKHAGSSLVKSLSPRKIAKLQSPAMQQVARTMMSGAYDTTYRAASYNAYQTPETVGRALKIGDGFSRYENITGMYLPEGEHVIIVGPTAGKTINLQIPDWMRQPTPGYKPTEDPNGWDLKCAHYPLVEGVNVIQVKKAGNAYIDYYDADPANSPAIKIHFVTGQVNGYFDAMTMNNAQWNALLDNAVSPVMDARGTHIQVAYPVEWFKTYTYNKGADLIGAYDKMLQYKYDFMGLTKYGKTPKNHILARVNFNYYMFRDEDGVAYLGDKRTMRMVADPSVVVTGDPCWGFSHEVGHVLQMRPQLTWGGMTEVSNNLYSLNTSALLGNPSRIKEQNTYAKARQSIIESSPKISFLQDPDVFNRLVPFWQLHLYFSKNGRPDFYADVMETMRNRDDAGTGDESINNMFEFVKIVCDVSKTDLTDFFDQWGFFYVGNIKLGDYADYNFNITQAQVDDAKAYIAGKKYPQPPMDLTTVVE